MKPWITIVAGLLLVVSGCKGKSEEPRPQTKGQVPAPDMRQAQTEHSLLRIEAEMLRDLKITTALVEERPGGEGMVLLGELHVNENTYAEVGPPIAARVLAVHAASGQFVSSGQPLATLQSTELGKARSQLITANARLEFARQTLERKRRLSSERIVSQREVQEAEAVASAAEADLRAARAELQALGVSISLDDSSDSSQFTVRSPIAGTVLERAAIRGQLADPAQPLFRIGDLANLWLTVQAFERDAVRLKPGFPVRTTFAALPGRTFTGKVGLIGKQVNPQSRTIPVRVDVHNDGGLLRPGMSASAWVTPGTDAPKILTVPAAAMQRIADDWVAFIPRSPDTFEIRHVGRGRDLGSEIEVLSGLKTRETVVVDGSFLLKAEADKARGEGEEHEH
jgi:membrane fusion protein, heavy metal efflux system